MFDTHLPLALVANGNVEDIKSLLISYPLIVAVDGGVVHLDRMGITPSLIIGDFDSAPPLLLEKYKHIPHIHTPDQNKSDLEKTLEYLEQYHPHSLTVFGAIGKRLDHTLYNINLLARYKGILSFETENEIMYVIDNGTLIKSEVGRVLSLIPLNGPVTGVTTKGLKWELQNSTLSKDFVGLSNLCLETEVRISYLKGDLLLCLNKRFIG